MKRFYPVLLVTILALACKAIWSSSGTPLAPSTTPEAHSPPHAARPRPRATSAPDIDVAAMMAHVESSFRRAADGTFLAANPRHQASVDLHGVLAVSARKAHEPSPLRLETVTAGRDRAPDLAPPRSPAITGEGTVAIERGAVRETLRSTEAGVEQSWSFQEKPSGRGDLVVRVRVTGASGAPTDSGDILLTPYPSGAQLRYGAATWIDGRGERTAVPARYVDGLVVLRVPASVVEGSTYPAILDPLVSPEKGSDTPIYGPAWDNQYSVAVGFDGTSYLVVWADHRKKAPGGGIPDLYATHVSAQGQVLDQGGLRITSNAVQDTIPSIAFDGTNYLVAWQAPTGIMATRVATTGLPLDAGGFQITAGANLYPHVACGGGACLVSWRDANTIQAAMVSTAGMPSASFTVSSTAVAFSSEETSVAWGGSSFLIAWQATGTTIRATRVSSAGQVIGTPEVTVASRPYEIRVPSVASDGSSWLLAWEANPTPGLNTQIEAVVVDSAGSVVGSPTTISHSSEREWRPQVAFMGTQYFVTWGDWRNAATTDQDIYGVRVDLTGNSVDASDIIVCNAPAAQGPNNTGVGTLALACDPADGTCFAAWNDARNTLSGDDIYGTRIGANGISADTTGIPVATSANREQSPAVATDGTSYLVVWQDFRNGAKGDIYGVVLGADGVPTNPAGLLLTVDGEEQSAPSVAWGGSSYLVAWTDKRNNGTTGYDIYGARVSADGTVLDPGGKPLSNAPADQTSPSVGSNGTGFFVVWQDSRQGQVLTYGRGVDAAGTLVGVADIAIDTTDKQYAPVIASDGAGYLVVWQSDAPSGPEFRVVGRRVDAQGQPLDPASIWISPHDRNALRPRVAFGGSHYLVTWSAMNATGVSATRVGADGGVLDSDGGIYVGTAVNPANAAAVAWDSYDYLVIWQKAPQPNQPYDLAGARVSVQGVVLDPAEISISADESDETAVAAVSNGNGQSLIVYEHNALVAPYGNKRVFARLVSLGDPLGKTCASDNPCNSDLCVDGVCCDKPCGGGDPSDCLVCNLLGHEGTCMTDPGASCAADGGSGGSESGASQASGTMGATATSSGPGGAGAGGGAMKGPGGERTSLFACAMGNGPDAGDTAWRWVLIGGAAVFRIGRRPRSRTERSRRS